MYLLWTLCLLLSTCRLTLSASVRRLGPPPSTPLTIQIDGYAPQKNDQYVCTSSKRLEPGYILSYEPTANADRVHHMLLYGCEEPVQVESTWPGARTCQGPAKILFAWARNAPGLQMPVDVGLAIGHEGDNVNYLVLQIHYATPFNGDVRDYTGVTMQVTTERPRNLAAVYIFVGGNTIPMHLPAFFVNMSCPYNGETEIHPFAFRTHTHMMGRVVSAFYKHDQQWTMIGKRNPQWPQMFEKINRSLTISPGDEMAAMCRYDSSQMDHDVSMGGMGSNEMCNFYMMYYRDADAPDPFPQGGACGGVHNPTDFVEYPPEGQTLLPSMPELEEHAHQSAITFGNAASVSVMRKRGYGDSPAMYDSPSVGYGGGLRRRRPPLDDAAADWQWQRDRARAPMPNVGDDFGFDDPSAASSAPPPPSAPAAPVPPPQLCGDCIVDRNRWTTIGDVKLGQVSGLARDQNGNLVVFHRGPRVWGGDTFDYSHKLNDQTAIDSDVVLVVDTSVNPPKLLSKWGRQQFYLPHGVFVDKSGAFYMTDVGSHQVTKYTSGREGMTLAFALGEKFVPGSDEKHLCQPSGVAVASDGSIFVSDGYCNSRVVKYSADGQFLFAFGERSAGAGPAPLGTFMLPHDIVIDEARKLIRVADRQNGRVQAFQMDGVAVSEVRPPDSVKTIYSMDIAGDTIYLLPGERPVTRQPEPIRAFAADVNTNLLSYSWAPKSHVLERPHILRASANGRFLYVGEISGDGGIVWQLEVTREWGKVTMVHPDEPSAPVVMKGNGGDQQSGVVMNKPSETSDQTAGGATVSTSSSKGRLTLLVTAVSVPLIITVLVCLCLRCRKGGSRLDSVLYRGKPFLDRNGFKPLKTEDIDALDDLTTDESDQEDTLYASKPKPPLKT